MFNFKLGQGESMDLKGDGIGVRDGVDTGHGEIGKELSKLNTMGVIG